MARALRAATDRDDGGASCRSQHLPAFEYVGKGRVRIDAGIPVQRHARCGQSGQRLLCQTELLQRLIGDHEHIGVTNICDATTQISR